MKNPFTRLFRARDKPGATDSVSSAPTFYFGSSAAGKSVTASTAIQMSTVYACVRVIAETIASLPLHVYQNQGEGSVKAQDHPLYPILHDEPNSEMTSFVWRETMLAHLLLWGNAYCQIIRSGRSQRIPYEGGEGTGESADGNGSGAGNLTLPEFIYSTYNSLLESGWRMDEIDRMDMPGFLKMRAWNARQEQKKKEPRQRYIDEVWSSLKPGGL